MRSRSAERLQREVLHMAEKHAALGEAGMLAYFEDTFFDGYYLELWEERRGFIRRLSERIKNRKA